MQSAVLPAVTPERATDFLALKPAVVLAGICWLAPVVVADAVAAVLMGVSWKLWTLRWFGLRYFAIYALLSLRIELNW